MCKARLESLFFFLANFRSIQPAQFGAGTRVCLGKHVSLFEISKLIPQLLRKYDIKQTDPEAELTICSYWFVLQKGLICRVTRRRTSYTDHFGA